MSKNERKTYFVVLGGMIAALSVIFMLLSALFPIADLVFPALAGILLICTVCEMGEGWSFIIFAAVSILSLLILPDKEPAIYYILFLGHYPILKSFIERIKNKPFKWAVKLILFNICTAVALLVSIALFGISGSILEYSYPLIALLFNVTFVIYDIAVGRLVVLYRLRIQKIIRRH